MRLAAVAYVDGPKRRGPKKGSLAWFLKKEGIKARVYSENPIPITPEDVHRIFVHLEPIVDGLAVAVVGKVSQWAWGWWRARKKDPSLQKFSVVISVDEGKKKALREKTAVRVDLTKTGVQISVRPARTRFSTGPAA